MDVTAPNITFIIGEEKRLAEIINRAEIEPLLRSAMAAGFRRAAVLDDDGLPISFLGDDSAPLASADPVMRHTLYVEGEPRGTLLLDAGGGSPLYKAIALVIRDVLQHMVTNNLKRMLTTEAHTSVVLESYEQLLESNRRLAESEARYKALALDLERQVEKRTAELKKAYARMLQQEKLASVGQLAAGMAHEINNPNGFILSNLTTFRKYVSRFKEMQELYDQLASRDITLETLRQQTGERRKELKLDFIFQDSEELLKQSIEGTERIKKIVADLKSFSHIDEAPDADTDLNTELERTLSVMAPGMPPDVTIERNLTELPRLRCNPALLCQAFMNIFQNSLSSRETGLRLHLSTALEGDQVAVIIADNGCGIHPEHLGRVFDPFFTTHDVGFGTGMGLTVTREIIVSYGGSIEIESDIDVGTRVIVRLPLTTGGTRHVQIR